MNTRNSTTRPQGRECQAVGWLMRHPLFVLTPAAVSAALVELGALVTGVIVAGLVVVVLVWWRGHPPSFDRYLAPRLRTAVRRWGVYRGGRWRGVLADCDLTNDDRRHGTVLYPRISRVRSVTPTVDTLRVRMIRGHDVGVWTERLPALADALGAHRVAVTRSTPGYLSVVVEREMPFRFPVDPTPIPATVAGVDLEGCPIGEDEYGEAFRIRIRGRHLLVVGGTGAGKSGALWNPLRAIAPLIREGLVRVWVIDLKGGTETELGAPLFYRWAITGADAKTLLEDFRDSMVTRQAQMRATKTRHSVITRATPLDLLVIDELAMVTAYGDRYVVRDCLTVLAEILTQGRAADHCVMAYVQEPTKDVVDVRDLFTAKLCLGVTTASHVDMALGDGSRERGALADEIPNDPDHAGIGFAIQPGSRLPVRFRLGWVRDPHIDELVQHATPPQPAPAEVPSLPAVDDAAPAATRVRLAYTDDEPDEPDQGVA
ncbi:MAG: FtsK/SpoIIIE domain-containing protein [Pseudonocardia sp.]